MNLNNNEISKIEQNAIDVVEKPKELEIRWKQTNWNQPNLIQKITKLRIFIDSEKQYKTGSFEFIKPFKRTARFESIFKSNIDDKSKHASKSE